MFRLILILFVIILPVEAFAQHDPCRNAVLRLADNKADAAVRLLARVPRRTNSRVTEAERYFVLAMAACQQGNPAAALKKAKQAVDNGLPIERFQAGPRDIFAALYAHSDFKTWLAPQRKQLLHGPLLGSVTDSSAGFWVRTAEEADVQIIVQPVSKNESKPQSVMGEARTSSRADYTASIKVIGLKPDTQYKYKVLINAHETGPYFDFRTYPEKGTPARFSIAFGGGAGFTPQYERMWLTVAKHRLSALLLLGDNVYIDDPTHPLTQRYCYYRRQSRPEWRSLVASTGVYSIYDDHDFGLNDCVPGPDIEEPEWKRWVWNIFKENWINPAYGGGTTQPGCWYSFYIGDVHFIMLDCRYYRDRKSGSMLGPVQKAWLFESLKSSEGKFKVLASSVPWSPGVKRHSKDTWDGYPDEREEIFSFIEKHRIDGVILMAADRHRSDFRRIKRFKGYDFYEVMSSRLTNVHSHSLMKNAQGSEFIMGYNKSCSFGILAFNTVLNDPQVEYTIVNIDNEAIDSRILKLSELSFGVPAGN